MPDVAIEHGGKSVYGANIDILMLEARFPRIPGDIGNQGLGKIDQHGVVEIDDAINRFRGWQGLAGFPRQPMKRGPRCSKRLHLGWPALASKANRCQAVSLPTCIQIATC